MKENLFKRVSFLRGLLSLFLLVAITGNAWGETKTDVLNQAFTGITGTSYVDFQDKSGTSGAIYAGNCAGSNNSIQLRSKNENSGIVTTGSGGKAKKIIVVWDTNTQNGRKLNIYGKNTAYNKASQLYNTTGGAGDLLGNIVCGTSTELIIDGDYEYIGLRSSADAMYLTSVSIEWESNSTPAVPCTVTFNAGSNGTCSTASLTESSAGAGITLPNVTANDGYNFKGWSTSSSPTSADAGVAGATYKPSGDCTLYAYYKQTHTAKFYVNGAQSGETQTLEEGEAIIFPVDPVDINGKTFVGWSESTISGTTDTRPTLVTSSTMGNENKTYYAVFATKTTGDESLVETIGFESSEGYTAGTTYNSSSYTTGSQGSKWKINYGAFSTNNAIIGSQSAQFRIYSSGGGYGQLTNTVAYSSDVTKVEYSAKSTNTNGKVKVSYSVNGSTWTDITTQSLTTTTTEYSADIPVEGVKYIKFTATGTKPSSSNYSIYVDGVKIYSGASTYTDYCTTVNVRTLTGIEFGGTLTKSTYNENEVFSPEGITVLASYEGEAEKEDVTSQATLTYNQDPLVAGTSTITVNASYGGMEVNGVYNITVNSIPTLTTIDQIFEAARTAGTTATDVKVTFENWIVSGVKNNNAYVTDGSNGFIIYTSGHGFEVGDILSGTSICKVQLYRGSAELTSLTSSTTGLTVTKGGTITPQEVTIANLSGVNTGAVINFPKIAYSGTAFWDGENSITPYNTFITLPTLESQHKYNVTGVYIQYDTTREIAPRTLDDIQEVSYNISLSQVEGGIVGISQKFAQQGETVTLTVEPAIGYDFTSWNVINTETNNKINVSNDNTFVMPGADVNVSATFTSNGQEGIVITYSSIDFTSYTESYQALPWTQNNVSGQVKVCNTNDQTMQFKENCYVYNTTPVPGNIRIIKLTYASGSSQNWKAYVGTTIMEDKPASGGSDPMTVSSSQNPSLNVTGENSYFYIVNTSGYDRLSKIEIIYDPVAPKTPSTLSWSAPSATVTRGAQDNEFPTLAKDPVDLSPITYNSSNTDVATIDTNGDITLAGKGETTITASFAGDETYAPSSASYTLKVELKKYTVNIVSSSEGSIVVKNGDTEVNNEDLVEEGTSLSVEATANPGYRFSNWNITGATVVDANSPSSSFTVANNVTVAATFNSIPTYAIRWSINGNISVPELVEVGSSVTPPTVSIPDYSTKVFIGWTEYEIPVPTDDVPVYTTTITATKSATYYALFADKKSTPSQEVDEGEVIAYWPAQNLTANTPVNAAQGTGQLTSSITLSGGNELYSTMNTSVNNNTLVFSGLDFSEYSGNNITLIFAARGSQGGTITVSYSTDGSTYTSLVTTQGLLPKTIGSIEVPNIPTTAKSVKLQYNGTGSFFFGEPIFKAMSNDISYNFTKLTDENTIGWQNDDWEGYYVIAHETNALSGAAIAEKNLFAISPTDGNLTLNNINDVFKVTRVDDKYTVQGLGYGRYLAPLGTNSVQGSTTESYVNSISYNSITANDLALYWNSAVKFGFYGSKQTADPTLYKIMNNVTYSAYCTLLAHDEQWEKLGIKGTFKANGDNAWNETIWLDSTDDPNVYTGTISATDWISQTGNRYEFKLYSEIEHADESVTPVWWGTDQGIDFTNNRVQEFNEGYNRVDKNMYWIHNKPYAQYKVEAVWTKATDKENHWYWHVTIKGISDTYLPGQWNDWNATDPNVMFDEDGILELNLATNRTYEFKVANTRISNTWYGNNGTMTSNNCTGWKFSTNEGNCGIEASITGTYTFYLTWNGEIPSLSVEYPRVAIITLSDKCNDSAKHHEKTYYYGSYSNAYAFIVPEDLRVAVVGVDENSLLVVNEFKTGDVVPANTGLMVSSENYGDHEIVLTNKEVSALPGVNNLRPSGPNGITPETMASNDTNCIYYRLTMHQGTQIGYWWGAENGGAFGMSANKAYLVVPEGTQVKSGAWFSDDELNGIENISISSNTGEIYNLNGQRVITPVRGQIYIMNGHKFIAK